MVRRLFEDHFESMHNQAVYCFGTGLDFVLLALMKRVAAKNRVVFMENVASGYPLLYTLKSAIVYCHLWMCYGIRHVRIFDVNGQPYPFLSDGFYENTKTVKQTYKHMYQGELARRYSPTLDCPGENPQALVLDDDCWLYERTPGDASRISAYIRQRLAESLGNASRILYKRHPNPRFHATGNHSTWGDYSEYPYYMPAEFILCNPEIRWVVGGSSVVLSAAAKHTSAIAISYLKLVPFRNESYKQRLIEYLVDAGGKRIVFLERIEDLAAFVEGV